MKKITPIKIKTYQEAYSFTLIMILVALISLISCSPEIPVLYTAAGQNVPLFQKKGEIAMSGGFASASPKDYNYNDFDFTPYMQGFNIQFAMAVDSSVAIISSLYSLSEDDDFISKGNYFELGIGKFKYNLNSNLTGEIFIGAGFGSLKNSMENQSINARYFKVFIQPSGGYSSEIIDVAFTPRVGLVTHTSNSSILNDPAMEQSFSGKKTKLVFEPGVTLRVGYKNVKLQYQFNYSTFHYNDTDEIDPVYPRFGSLGLYVLIPNRWKNKKVM
jgi:hypothetical protein